MRCENPDVIVIGGGPAGSATAAFLAQQGRSVLLLERGRHPRFHVGESLLPMTQAIWDRLGIADDLQHLGQTFKYGAQWRIGVRPDSTEVDRTCIRFHVVPNAVRQPRGHAYQVRRSVFDHKLLQHAAACGVDVQQEARVDAVVWEGDRAVAVRWRDSGGVVHVTPTSAVADCSGRRTVVARDLALRQPDPELDTTAVFAHFRGVARDEGIDAGNITLHLVEHGWFWLIPLSDDVMSVGLVVDETRRKTWGDARPRDILFDAINRYAFVREAFVGATVQGPVRCMPHLPYAATRCAGENWALVGDAAFFVDPLFSSGVHVAFASAERAAAALGARLDGDDTALAAYDRWARRYCWRVAGTVRRMYRMLRSRLAIRGFVKVTGDWGNHWNNPYLRRLNAWGLGRFDDYVLWLLGGWLFTSTLAWIGEIRGRWLGTGWPGWDAHCTADPLPLDVAPLAQEAS